MKPAVFMTPSLQGLLLKDVKHFNENVHWKSPLFRMFFDTFRIDADIEKVNLINDFFQKTFAIILIVLFSPILLSVAIALKYIDPKGSIFYTQVRVGKNGKLFNIIKFRSMITNAETLTGHTLSWDGDPRITPFGNFLRKSHFDELPQLFNVLKGDMVFIGPRPERPEFTEVYDEEIEGYSERHFVKPGITGLAQIALVYDATAKQKLKYDLMYIGFRDSMLLNVLIAVYTAKKMLFMKSTVDLV
jgi:lipopolysaccharide/colanic/teichoic acid biosynthesis glycosyltransferase